MRLLAGRGIVSRRRPGRFPGPGRRGSPRSSSAAGRGARFWIASLARRRDHERVLVYGDFDADGLTGLSILVLALRALGMDAEPYVPERLGDGHGLSLRAIERAVTEGRTLIITADCGTSSGAEIEIARQRGIDVIVTDHHHAPEWPAAAVAVVNPQRADSVYPETRLTGAGVAWKVAHLLIAGSSGRGVASAPLPDSVRALADLALIGTVGDVAPALGENRSIARIGLDCLRTRPRPGLAALLDRAGLAADRLSLDDIGFAVAPRLNAAGRVGEASRAARLLLSTDRAEAEALADELEQANRDRREMTRTAVAEARRALGLGPGPDDATPPDGGPGRGRAGAAAGGAAGAR